MDILFIFGLGWGVAGAALATSFSQYVGVGAMLYLLHRRRILNFADMLRIPSFGDVAPLLRVQSPSSHALLGKEHKTRFCPPHALTSPRAH